MDNLRDNLWDNLWNNLWDAGWWLNPTPLKKLSSSIGMMTFPINMEKKMFETTNQLGFVNI